MPNVNGNNRNALNRKRFIVDLVGADTGGAGILKIGEDVGKFAPELIEYRRAGIDWNLLTLPEIERPHLVHTSRMVFVFVGKQHRVQVSQTQPQHLLSKVRPSVDQQAFPRHLNVHGCPQAFVAEINRPTNSTGATNHRHTRRCSGSKERNEHSRRLAVSSSNWQG